MRLLVTIVLCGVCAGGAALGQRAAEPESAGGAVDAIFTAVPKRPQAGMAATLRFSISEGGEPVDDLVLHHDRKLHVVLISEDMQIFGHVHPEDFGNPLANGEYSVQFTFPRAGRYIAAADLATEAGTYAEHFLVEVEGEASVPAHTAPAALAVVEGIGEDRYTAPVIFDAPRPADGYELSVARPRVISAGSPATFVWRLIKDSEPITDLRFFLAAPMHIAVVKDDLSHFVHGHGSARRLGTGYDHVHGAATADDSWYRPDDIAQFGPEIAATFTFPEPGRYYLFGQAAHGESLLISRVPVDVR